MRDSINRYVVCQSHTGTLSPIASFLFFLAPSFLLLLMAWIFWLTTGLLGNMPIIIFAAFLVNQSSTPVIYYLHRLSSPLLIHPPLGRVKLLILVACLYTFRQRQKTETPARLRQYDSVLSGKQRSRDRVRSWRHRCRLRSGTAIRQIRVLYSSSGSNNFYPAKLAFGRNPRYPPCKPSLVSAHLSRLGHYPQLSTHGRSD
jgi:hypothetical protein